MLTLKAPIQLHIGQGLTGNSEAFSERIRGNYSLLSAKFTPKDLLFLLTTPPEVPEETGGMTTLVSQQTQVDARSVTLDVVNNVINRILLDGTSQFTYQDQVYITSVLNRLGITNVEQFMAQVRQLRSENENTVHLTRLYRAELERTLRQQAAGETGQKRSTPATTGEEEPARAGDPRISMSMNILQRLETANLYETVHAFQRNWSVAENRLTRNEMRLAEQLRFSNVVSLTEQRQQVFQYPQVHMQHHLNQFETGTILEIPRDEEAVLSQAAVAALVTAVDNTVTEVLSRPQLHQEQWVRLENALWQTAENTLSRFETYHNYQQMLPEAASVERERLYHRELSRLEETYLRERQEQETILRTDRRIVPADVRTETLTDGAERQAEALPAMKLSAREMPEDLFRQNVPQELLTPESQQTIREAMRVLEEPGQVLRETISQLPLVTTVHPELPSEEEEAVTAQIVQEASEAVRKQMTEGPATVERPDRTVIMEAQEKLRQQTAAQETAVQETQQTIREVLRVLEEPGQVLRETISQLPPAATVHPDLPSGEEAETVAAQTAQKASVAVQKQPTEERSAVQETQRAIREVLQALEEPGQVLRETISQLPLVTTVHPDLPSGEEAETVAAQTTQEASTEVRKQPAEGPAAVGRQERTVIMEAQEELRQQTAAQETAVQETQRTIREVLRVLEEPGQVLREFHTEQNPVSVLHPPQSVDEEMMSPGESLRIGGETTPVKLVEELTRIDQQNRTVIQNVQQELRQRRSSVMTPTPDVQRTMQDARRALESQDEVLREIYREREAAPTVHPAFTAEEEVLLKQADPVTRALYERVLLYQKNPEAAFAQGLVRPGNLGALNAELRQAAEDAPVVLEHMETLREREELWHQSETVLEQFHRQPVVPRQQMPAAQQPALHMVHKQLPSEITEELLEQLEERQTQRTVKVESSEEITRQNIHRTDMTQMERQVVTQTSEDITELVNRTLAKQMRTISDQVYRQMEKRLQAERNRRGRF